MRESKTGLSDNPWVVFVSLIASIIAIIVFLTGKENLPSFFASTEVPVSAQIIQPTTTSVPASISIVFSKSNFYGTVWQEKCSNGELTADSFIKFREDNTFEFNFDSPDSFSYDNGRDKWWINSNILYISWSDGWGVNQYDLTNASIDILYGVSDKCNVAVTLEKVR